MVYYTRANIDRLRQSMVLNMSFDLIGLRCARVQSVQLHSLLEAGPGLEGYALFPPTYDNWTFIYYSVVSRIETLN